MVIHSEPLQATVVLVEAGPCSTGFKGNAVVVHQYSSRNLDFADSWISQLKGKYILELSTDCLRTDDYT